MLTWKILGLGDEETFAKIPSKMSWNDLIQRVNISTWRRVAFVRFSNMPEDDYCIRIKLLIQ